MGRLNPFYGTGNRKAIMASAIKNRRAIVQIDNNNNVINEFSSCVEAAKHFNVPHPSIYRVCTGEYSKTHDLYFRFKGFT